MAAQKKASGSGGKRQAGKPSGGKRTASTVNKSTSTARKTTSSASGSGKRSTQKQQPRPIRREVGAVVCLILAVFAALGYFQLDGIFINFFCHLLEGLIGYGFYLAPVMLLMTSYILAFHRGRPVRLRMWCALLLPVILGAVIHLFAAGEAVYPAGVKIVSALWKDGLLLKSGGVAAGLLAIGFKKLFSTAGAAIVLIVLGFLMVLGACNRTVLDLADAAKDRKRVEYDEDDYPEPEPKKPRRAEKEEEPAPVQEPVRKSRPVIDIPVEDGPLVGKTPPKQEPEEVLENRGKGSFFNRKARVKRPDEVLAGLNGAPEVEEAPGEVLPEIEEPKAEPVPVEIAAEPAAPVISRPAPAPTPAPAAPVFDTVPITREPAVQKAKPEETARAADEVAQAVEQNKAAAQTSYQYPPLSLLNEGDGMVGSEALGELQQNQKRLADTIRSFNIDANITNVTRGPSVTRYELELDQGVRLNRLTNLADDIALALGAAGVRIAPIPGKSSMVGIEVPNRLVTPVPIHDVIGSREFCDHPSKVAFALGKDIGGNCIVGNIAKLPHLLIAGTTGSGKSVCTNSLIISLLYKATPEEVRLIMVDPKMVELGIYNGIPHLLIPVVTDPKKAAGALQWAVNEMMKRYRAFSEAGVRDLASFNKVASSTEGMEKMPQVVVVIDELADLMLVAAKEVEESICRIAQMGRASGIHLIIATQRPSADVITGLMKANIPSRIAFAVASALESRIILDTQGAEKLVGRGDMLYAPLGNGKPLRVQGCLISDEEVARVVEFVKKSGTADYSEEVLHEIEQHVAEKEKGGKGAGSAAAPDEGGDYDELLPNAIEVVVETGMASVSMLQRRLKLGYSRAARLVDQMEEQGIVGPFEGSKPRQVLITKAQWQEMRYRQSFDGTGAAPEPEMPVEEPLPPEDFDDGAYDGGDGDEEAPF